LLLCLCSLFGFDSFLTQFQSFTRDIQLKNFDVSIGGRKLLVEASITLAQGRKYGLVGRNGYGKTTLFRALSNGEITLPHGLLVLHVEQEVGGVDGWSY
jgi:ATP-binding cassette subfamily F protein 3